MRQGGSGQSESRPLGASSERGRERDRGRNELGRHTGLVELGLRGPTLGTLQRLGILSVAQLLVLTPEELMGMRRVGMARMLEVRQALQARGLDLRVDAAVAAEPVAVPRTWDVTRRIRLSCCEVGECSLELKTAGASPEDLGRVAAAFVAIHRGCPRLAGREPIIAITETRRPTSSAAERGRSQSA